MFQTIFASLLGVLFGLVIGLIPGMHMNNFVGFVVELKDWPINLASFLIGGVVSYNFFEFLRTNLLSMPSDSGVLSVHPVRKMIAKGMGIKAMKLFAFGALASNFLFLTAILILIQVLPFVYSRLREYMVIVLIVVIILLITREKEPKKILLASIFFLMSGLIGVTTFVLELNNPFLPMLSGFFGVGYIISNMNTSSKLPSQIESIKPRLKFRGKLKACIMGYFSSFLMVLIPSVTSSQSTLITRLLTKSDEEEFITSIGSTANFDVLFSLTSLYLINRSRSGTIEGVKTLFRSLNWEMYFYFIMLTVSVSLLSYFLFINLGKFLFRVMRDRNLKWVYISSIILISIFCLYFDGFLGLGILCLSSYIGYLANKKDVHRYHMLGCLNLVTLLLFLGFL